MPPLIEDRSLVLFIGDSITDAGRSLRDDRLLGSGFAMMIASWFAALYPEKNVRFLNRGLSGDRIGDLASRWRRDCLDPRPSWITLLIGINDTWRRFDGGLESDHGAFDATYRGLIESGLAHNARFILMEPFLLPVREEQHAWREDLAPRIHTVRDLAAEFDQPIVPLDHLFAQALSTRPAAFWAADGIHPTPAGHAFIAQHWLHTMQAG